MLRNDVWDEYQWEAYLRDSDALVDRYMDLLFGFLADHPVPRQDDGKARKKWQTRLQRYLESKGWSANELPLAYLSQDLDVDEKPKEWLSLDAFEDEPEVEINDSFHELPVYQQSFALATEVMNWANALPGQQKDSTLVQFCNELMIIPSNIAKGHGIGYDREMLGGNIACIKRALNAANTALIVLRDMKGAAYMDCYRYVRFYEKTYEVRNALGLYVQELRRRFELGVD